MILKILNSSDDERFFYAYDAAKRLNMDISELIFKAVKRNPVKRCGYLSIVYKNPEYANELTKIYEEILPLTRWRQEWRFYICRKFDRGTFVYGFCA